MRPAYTLLAALTLHLGCGGGTREVAQETTPSPSPQSTQHEATPARVVTSPRDLAANATFADLVAAARRQDDLRDQDSTAGCLLRVGASYRLEADLAAAVRPLPEAPTSLDTHADAVAVLTRYGTIGPADASLGFVAFTTTQPVDHAEAAVLIVQGHELFVARTSERRAQPIEASAIAALDDGHTLLFVTATARTSVGDLSSVLRAIPASMAGRVGLAVALPSGTRLAAVGTATEAPPSEAICTLSTTEEPPGDLSVDAIRAGVQPLIARAETCVGTSEGRGALGGRVVLSMRIGAHGEVSEACISEDPTDDGVLRACLVRAARALSFAAPTNGTVDVDLPLVLASGVAHRQRALCD